MFSFRTRLILLSSLFGVGCLVCVAALALRRKRRLKANKLSSNDLRRQLIANELKQKRKQRNSISRRKTLSTGSNTMRLQNDEREVETTISTEECNNQVTVGNKEDASRSKGDNSVPLEIDLKHVMGDLENAINQLETTLKNYPSSIHNQPQQSVDESSIILEIKRLQDLLDLASSNDVTELSKLESDKANIQGSSSEDGYSSEDSFVSAAESITNGVIQDPVAFTSESSIDVELDSLLSKNRGALYASAVKHMKNNEVPVRSYRTKMLLCDNDLDFCAKTFCLRLAFQHAFSDEANRDLFTNYGKGLITELLIKSDKDPKGFSDELDGLIEYCCDQTNWRDIEDELSNRGVLAMTFFDIVLDFVVLDSLEDLEDPPYAVTTAIQNRWLSQSIKETALTTAIWSILAAKSRMLKNQDGFLRRLYSLSQHMTPVLAWGLLGPIEELKRMCTVFKDGLIGYLRDIFNTDLVSYENKEQLSEDIVSMARRHHADLLRLISS